jgi:hypothetical protein
MNKAEGSEYNKSDLLFVLQENRNKKELFQSQKYCMSWYISA